MAGTTGITTGIDTQLLVKTANVSTINVSSTATFATATTAATGFAITGTPDFFPGITDVGSHGRTANTGTYGVYGEDAQRTYTSQATRPDFTFQYAEDRNNAKHIAMLNMKVGGDIAVAVFTKIGAGESIAVMTGELSGLERETPLDSPAMVTVTVAVNVGPLFLDKT